MKAYQQELEKENAQLKKEVRRLEKKLAASAPAGKKSMASEESPADADIVEERNKLRAIIDAMDSGVTIRDLDYNITFQSKMTLELFGDRKGEITAKKLLHDNESETPLNEDLQKEGSAKITEQAGKLYGTWRDYLI